MRISILYVIWIVYSANCCVIIHLNCILNVNLNHLGLKNLALSQSLQRLIYLLFSVLSWYCFRCRSMVLHLLLEIIQRFLSFISRYALWMERCWNRGSWVVDTLTKSWNVVSSLITSWRAIKNFKDNPRV